MIEIHFKSINSTNLFAKENASSFDKTKIYCISAEEQTCGYGQFQRKWISPHGVNLYTTFYFIIPKTSLHLEMISIKAASCLQKVLLEMGFSADLKWPNDVLIQEKKVAGVLCETIFQDDFIEIILGFGLNVNMDLDQLSKIDQKATSLYIESGRFLDKKALLKKIQKEFLTSLIADYNPEIIARMSGILEP